MNKKCILLSSCCMIRQTTQYFTWKLWLLKPTLFNIFLERIRSYALEEHQVTVNIKGGNITKFRFADNSLASKKRNSSVWWRNWMKHHPDLAWGLMQEKAQDEQWERTFNTYKFDGDELKFVSQFKYLGSIFSEEGTIIERLLIVSQITAYVVKLRTIWNNANIYLKSKIWLLSASFDTTENFEH